MTRPSSAPNVARQNLHRPADSGRQATIRVRDPRSAGRYRSDGGASHPARQQFADRYKTDRLRHLTAGPVGRELRLAEQYRMYQQGDVARRLAMHKDMARAKGVTHAAYLDRSYGGRAIDYRYQHRGRISPAYTAGCFRYHYHGPRGFASYCWYPRWAPWVSWSWHLLCDPWWDPRPVWCRPVVYAPSVEWAWWEYPAWTALPTVPSGTWVDVAPVVVEPRRFDLQLLAVRFVDPGHPDEKLGPRYRVWFRNNSQEPINRPFDVFLFAADDERLAADSPRAGVRVTGIEAGGTQAVDIRLPFEVYQMGRNQKGGPAPFGTLHVLVDANREVPEAFEANNGTRIAQADVLPVDPAAFELEPKQAAAGGEVLLAGEGFGPEPGRVLIHMAGLEMDAEILGWYDLGVRLALPALPLAGPTEAELIVVRGDGTAANPLKLSITPPKAEPIPLPPPLPRER